MFTNATRIALMLIAAACAALGLVGCNAHTPTPDVETVGAIASTNGSSYRQPVHATTDLTPTTIVTTPSTDADDEGFTVKGAPADELPEVAPKSDGISFGASRSVGQ